MCVCVVLCVGRVRCFVWEGCLVWGEGCCVSVCGESVVSAQGRFYWPGFTEAVRTWSLSSRKVTIPNRKAELQTIRAGYPMQIVGADIVGQGCK